MLYYIKPIDAPLFVAVPGMRRQGLVDRSLVQLPAAIAKTFCFDNIAVAVAGSVERIWLSRLFAGDICGG